MGASPRASHRCVRGRRLPGCVKLRRGWVCGVWRRSAAFRLLVMNELGAAYSPVHCSERPAELRKETDRQTETEKRARAAPPDYKPRTTKVVVSRASALCLETTDVGRRQSREPRTLLGHSPSQHTRHTGVRARAAPRSIHLECIDRSTPLSLRFSFHATLTNNISQFL